MTDIILSGIINVNGLEIPTNTKPPQISKLNKQYMVENFEDTDLIVKVIEHISYCRCLLPSLSPCLVTG